MLEYLRNASERPIAKVLIGILMFSFVGWGVAEWIFGATSHNNNIATVGDIKISLDSFNNKRQFKMYALSKTQQKQLYKDDNAMNDFNRQILSDMARDIIITNRANDMEFIVKDKQVVDYIMSNKKFQKDGKFAQDKFDEALAESGVMEEDFMNIVRTDIMDEMVRGSLDIPVNIPDFVVKAQYNSRYLKKKLEYVSVKFADFKISEKPTDDQLREFYAKNPQIVPESRQVSYVLLSGNLDKPDEYDAKYSKMQQLEDDIISGDSLSDAAKKHDAKFVKLNAFSMGNRPVDVLLSDSVVKKIFDMEQGLESEIIETKKGFVIFRVENIISEHNEDFERVRDKLVADWKAGQQKKQAYIHANDLLINLNKSSELKNAKSVTVSRKD